MKVLEKVAIAGTSVVSLVTVLGFLWTIASGMTNIQRDVSENTKLLNERTPRMEEIARVVGDAVDTQNDIVVQLDALQDSTLKILYINSVELVVQTSRGDTLRIPMTRVGANVHTVTTHLINEEG